MVAGMQALSGSIGSSAFAGRALQHAKKSSRLQGHRLVTKALRSRPYTVRRGDTFQSIAEKRNIDLEQLLKLNHSVSPDALVEGQTLILPYGPLSARDKEILAGIGPWTYRTYPVRAGEKLQDIISKRNIQRAEVEQINPDVDLDRLTAGQLIKLPAHKYTVREQEMMSTFTPAEYFTKMTSINLGTIIASGLLVVAAVWVWRQKNDDV